MGKIVDISEVLLDLGLSSSVTDEERAIVDSQITRAEGAVKEYLRYDPLQATRTEYYPTSSLNPGHRAGVWESTSSDAVFRRVSSAATDQLQVRHLPIRSITSLHIDLDGRSGTGSGAFGSDTLKAEGTDYWPNYDAVDSGGQKVCNDGIIRSHGLWPVSPGTVKLVYISGYTQAELHGEDYVIDANNIREAILIESIRRSIRVFVRKKHARVGFVAGTMKSERLGDYSYSIGSGDNRADSLSFGSSVISAETRELLSNFVNWGWNLQ